MSVNQIILVQIMKESISTKGPRVTGEISLAGRFFGFDSLSDKIMVSQKIKTKRTESIKRDYQKFKPNNVGVIIRTMEKQGEDELNKISKMF